MADANRLSPATPREHVPLAKQVTALGALTRKLEEHVVHLTNGLFGVPKMPETVEPPDSLQAKVEWSLVRLEYLTTLLGHLALSVSGVASDFGRSRPVGPAPWLPLPTQEQPEQDRQQGPKDYQAMIREVQSR